MPRCASGSCVWTKSTTTGYGAASGSSCQHVGNQHTVAVWPQKKGGKTVGNQARSAAFISEQYKTLSCLMVFLPQKLSEKQKWSVCYSVPRIIFELIQQLWSSGYTLCLSVRNVNIFFLGQCGFPLLLISQHPQFSCKVGGINLYLCSCKK